MAVFKNLPLNLKSVYVRGIAKGNCEIWIPVDSTDEKFQKQTQKLLQNWLDNQPVNEVPPVPPTNIFA